MAWGLVAALPIVILSGWKQEKFTISQFCYYVFTRLHNR